MPPSYAAQVIAQVITLCPEFLKDPADGEKCGGNAAGVALGADGAIHGHIFGEDRASGQRYYQIASRKVMQVWRTGYPTGRFEELVYSGKLDETQFGLQRPDLIGWFGGVQLIAPSGELIAAAFSGFRGFKDVEIIERAAEAIGLKVKKV